jgi:hypothetical protein
MYAYAIWCPKTQKCKLARLLDNLLCPVYAFQNNGYICICADFNTRIEKNDDFIAGVDSFPQRDVIDIQTNGYCEWFSDFLISANTYIPNGINCLSNDFTGNSSYGMPVIGLIIHVRDHENSTWNFMSFEEDNIQILRPKHIQILNAICLV